MAGLIIGIVVAVGVLTGCGFYFIPKYAMETTNGWITGIDSVISWIGTNWIATIIIAILLVIAILLAVGLKKRTR